jgi:hypothetical protein
MLYDREHTITYHIITNDTCLSYMYNETKSSKKSLITPEYSATSPPPH